MFFRTAWLVLKKDVAIEAKSWEVLTTTLFFAVSCVLIFAFAFVKEGRAVEAMLRSGARRYVKTEAPRNLDPSAAPEGPAVCPRESRQYGVRVSHFQDLQAQG